MGYFGWINIYVQGEKTTPHPDLHKLIQTLCEMAQKINEDVKKKGLKHLHPFLTSFHKKRRE